jgi:hypothetical protein
MTNRKSTDKDHETTIRAENHEKAQGAILGKAMAGLQEGEGMVLVLVTLQ